MSDQPDDPEKTSKMDEPPAKKAKQQGDWATMPMSAAQKSAEAPTSAAEGTERKVSPPKPPATASAPPKASATASTPPSAPATAQAPAPVSTPAMSGAPASGGGVGSFLSNFGINDPNTQKIVLFGGGGFILLCCLCTCVEVGFSMLGNFSQ
jgi:hypothetical protein